jgi:DNA-binding CsgD family transcriptional regulator
MMLGPTTRPPGAQSRGNNICEKGLQERTFALRRTDDLGDGRVASDGPVNRGQTPGRAFQRTYVRLTHELYDRLIAVGLDKRVLSLVGDLVGLLDLDELSRGLLHALHQEMPADWSALNEVPADLPRTISITDPPLPASAHTAFARYAAQNPIAAYFLRTRDGRATRISDLMTRRELHRLDIYRHVYGPLGVEYQIAFTLPSTAERILGVSLSRRRRDFTARERDLLNLARPYLIQIYRNALEYSRAAAGSQMPLPRLEALGLTHRQAEVLRLTVTGRSAPEVGSTLGIAPRTVHKHLENCYRVLKVAGRGEASRIAWTTARDGEEDPAPNANRRTTPG